MLARVLSPRRAARLQRIRIGLLAAAAVIGCVSCELEMPAKGYSVPNIPERITVNAYLRRSDSITKIYVSRSRSLNYNNWVPDRKDNERRFEFIPLGNSEVTLEDLTSGQSLRVVYDTMLRRFTVRDTAMPIVAGHEYRISVNANGLPSVVGQCRVPVVEPASLKAHRRSETRVEYNVTIPPGPKRLFMIREAVERFPITHYEELFFTSVQAVDGMVELVGRALAESSGDPTPISRMSATLYEFDEAMYEYVISVLTQSSTHGNPFATPAIVKGNVRNGFGIVGGYALVDSVRLQ